MSCLIAAGGMGVRKWHGPMCNVISLWLMVVALAGCGGANVFLTVPPGADPGPDGPMQECDPIEQACAAAPTQDTSIHNSQNTTRLTLPKCPNGIENIFVQNAGSSRPVAFVQCAAPAPATAPDGGVPLFGASRSR
jgi:hypothetical protein